MITDTGRVEQRLVELPGAGRAPSDVTELRQLINEKLGGLLLVRDDRRWSRSCVEQVRAGAARPDDRARRRCCWRRWSSGTEERIALAGTANLTRGGLLDFSGHDPPDPGGARGGGHPAQALRRGRAASTTRVLHRRRERVRGPARDLGRQHRVRPGQHRRRWAGRARPDPDGLPRHHRHGAGRGTLRRRGAGTELTAVNVDRDD